MDDFFASLTPEQLEQWFGLGAVDQESQLLEQQLAQAQALRQPSGQQYDSWGGALAGGMGDILRQIAGATKEGRLRPELQANAARQGKMRQGIAQSVFGRPDLPPELSSVAAAPSMAPLAPAEPLGPEAPYYLQRPVSPFGFGRG